MGPLGRMPAGGRNWEGFGSDPYLQGAAAAATIKGIQGQGVIATAKHYIGIFPSRREKERLLMSDKPMSRSTLDRSTNGVCRMLSVAISMTEPCTKCISGPSPTPSGPVLDPSCAPTK